MQQGLFHVTTNTKGRTPWCTLPRIPLMIVRDLMFAKTLSHSKLYAFCILPDHVHMILRPGPKGLSKFVESFKKNSARNIRIFLNDKIAKENECVFGSGPYVRSATQGDSDTTETADFSGWQKGFHDVRLTEIKQVRAAMLYVQKNAQGHELVAEAVNWPWSSLQFPKMIDALDSEVADLT